MRRRILNHEAHVHHVLAQRVGGQGNGIVLLDVVELEFGHLDAVDQNDDGDRLVALGAQVEIDLLGVRIVELDMPYGNEHAGLGAVAPGAVGVGLAPVVVEHAGPLVQPAKADVRADRRPHGLVELDILRLIRRDDPHAVQHAQLVLQVLGRVALLQEDEQVVVMDLAVAEIFLAFLFLGQLKNVLARRIHGVDRQGMRGGAPGQLIEQLVVEVDIGRIEVDTFGFGDQLVPLG